MNPLQIQLYVGAAAGRRARFERSPITFGRDPSNLLVIEDEHISRNHGEIRFDQGQWILINHSANGIKVNKKTIKTKPRPIQSGDEVSIQKTLLFSITIEPVEFDHGESSLVDPVNDPANPNNQGGPGARKKKKLWMGMAAYMGGLLLLIIFLATLGGGDGKKNQDNIPELSREQIKAIIREKLPEKPHRDDRYEDAVKRANDMATQTDMTIDGLYKQYDLYRTAIQYSEKNAFKKKDQTNTAYAFTNVQNKLADVINKAYEDAIIKLKRGDDQGAFKAFQKLLEIYPDTSSELYKNCQAKLNFVSKRLGKEKIEKEKKR